MICMCNAAHSGMLLYCWQPQNYVLPLCCCFWTSVRVLPKPSAPRRGRIDGILSLKTSCTCFYFYLQTSREPSVQTFKEYLALVSWGEKSSLTNSYYECAVE